jgi:hypothetical protein
VRATVPLLLVLLAPAAAPALGQQLAPSAFARFDPALLPSLGTTPVAATSPARVWTVGEGARSAATNRPDTGGLVFAGLLGGAAGLLAGGLVGDRLQHTPCEDCYLAALAGAVIGESLAIPLAVHLADGRRGQVAPGIIASLTIAAGGLAAAGRLDRAELLLAVPVLQIAAAVASEQHTARSASE